MTPSLPPLDSDDPDFEEGWNDGPLVNGGIQIDRDHLYLGIAGMMGLRATCPRAKGGTVITIDGRIVTTGYAGAPHGAPHCTDVGCLTGVDGGCQRTLHAEIAAITFAARHGISLDQGVLYTTMSPCLNCAKAILNAGIIRVVFESYYRDPTGLQLLMNQKMEVERITLEPHPHLRIRL